MKKLLTLTALTLLTSLATEAQLLKGLGDKIKNKAAQRADQKTDRSIDAGLDKMEGKEVKKVKVEDDGDVKIKATDGSKVKIEGEETATTEIPTAYTSKYDFVQGEKVIAYDDFSNTEVGDFPQRWNTNATAEVVTINSKPGKWLKITKGGIWHPEFINTLPDNFTLDFDLGVNNGFNSEDMFLNIANLSNPQEYTDYYHYINWRGKAAIHLGFGPAIGNNSLGSSAIQGGKDGNHWVDNEVKFKGWNVDNYNFAHISLWRQAQRLRVYLNGEKIWDLPRAFDAGSKYNAITFATYGPRNEDYFLLGNVRLAVGAPDTRNKLIAEGKFVTSGITFDVNSDKIKPESYGVLKAIASVLSENADVRIKITGHTDNAGDATKNLDLSKRRAAAVKAALASDFNIDASRMETDGSGMTKPIADNKTSEGKAQNRRVEFIKL